METEVLHLFRWHHTLASRINLKCFLDLSNVALREDTETSNIDFSSRHRSLWVDNDSNKRFLMLLIKWLCSNIDTRKPAAVSGVRVVPSTHVFRSLHLFTGIHVTAHELVCLISSVHTSLSALYWQRERVHHVECIYLLLYCQTLWLIERYFCA